MLFNEPVRFSPGLNSYDDFFEQRLNLGKYSEWSIVNGEWGKSLYYGELVYEKNTSVVLSEKGCITNS